MGDGASQLILKVTAVNWLVYSPVARDKDRARSEWGFERDTRMPLADPPDVAYVPYCR